MDYSLMKFIHSNSLKNQNGRIKPLGPVCYTGLACIRTGSRFDFLHCNRENKHVGILSKHVVIEKGNAIIWGDLEPVISHGMHKLDEQLYIGTRLACFCDMYVYIRFYAAANGDFSCLLSSVKKTVRWRETYGILSVQELETWSNVVFWHGFDVKHRPCLIVRLGLGCTSLPSHDRPRFAQAIISQVEHGVYHLLDATNAQITVVVDCEGLSPLKIPMQVMRTCSSLLQDHFPNRLGCLFVIRLPPMLRVIAQTFIQVLKPNTREKLRIEGERYQKILCEYLEALPFYLGGNCLCKICTEMQHPRPNEVIKTELRANLHEGRNPLPAHPTYEIAVDPEGNWEQLVRTAIIGLLMPNDFAPKIGNE
ncbi:hypothetical protein D8674_006589 [Pyrus ussuriensis x Pyrus communis]|uniref:CRAL-TRIO domain-containing protein n=1 Tax=Pyrus ussuriensis x Pyrus communis TaxID=2448454 RepID=A0A5N5G0E5_9ROSA|nr:hypothetical protein D8674_006589 [Pyrus ussuriensis x Pyrus communis]